MGYSSKPDALDDSGRPGSTRRKPRRSSFFGKLAVLAGLLAFVVVCRENLRHIRFHEYLYEVRDYKVDPLHIAGVGAGLAVLALLYRALSGRTRAGWPILGLLVCASAAGTWRYVTSPMSPGSPEQWVRDHVVHPLHEKWDQYRNGRNEPVAPAPVEVSAPVPEAPADPEPAVDKPKAVTPAPAAQPTEPEPDAPKSKLFPGL